MKIGSKSITELDTDFDILSLKDVNPYEIKKNNKSLEKNYSLKILIKFLPELLERKGININAINDTQKMEKKKESLQIMFNVLSKSLIRNFDETFSFLTENCRKNEIEICSTKESKAKSSILFNMQSGQLGYVLENLKQGILHKYFLKWKNNIKK